MSGQPHFWVTVDRTRHRGCGQVLHWSVVAVMVGQPVTPGSGAAVMVVVWWSPVAAAGAMTAAPTARTTASACMLKNSE